MADIDMDAITAITSLQRPGKPDLLGKIMGLFEGNSPTLITEIEDGLQGGNADSVRAAAHSLKSSAAYLGASEMSRLCKNIEHAARDSDLGACSADVERLRPCFEETLSSLQAMVDKAA